MVYKKQYFSSENCNMYLATSWYLGGYSYSKLISYMPNEREDPKQSPYVLCQNENRIIVNGGRQKSQ